jgi:hypothetical protein
MSALTYVCDVSFHRQGRGARKVVRLSRPATPSPVGRTPRVAKLMALAIRFDGLIRDGIVRDYAELARLGRVTRARITQIMNLLLLAPDLQEALLFLEPVVRGDDPVYLRQLLPVAVEPDWSRQRLLWNELLQRTPTTTVAAEI